MRFKTRHNPHLGFRIMYRVIQMQVIYADILFILNLYITYVLLLLTAFLTRCTVKRRRLLFASVLSGVYSLIIILPSVSEGVIAVSRIFALLMILLVAFRRSNFRSFLRTSVCFFTLNLLFAGFMFLLWYFFSPQNMYYNSGIVYFNISAFQLVASTAVCYILLKGAHKLISLKTPTDTVFDLEIYADGKQFCCRSLLDTGNTLTDPFSGLPVIIVSRDVLKDFFVPDINSGEINDTATKFRFVVCSTVSGEGILPAFRPEKVKISAFKGFYETDRVVVAITEKKLKNGCFGAILPCSLSSEQIRERGFFHA